MMFGSWAYIYTIKNQHLKMIVFFSVPNCPDVSINFEQNLEIDIDKTV
jgi:hypothetical protein